MLDDCRWLALEVKHLVEARRFYETHLDLSTVQTHPGLPERSDQAILQLGGGDPGSVLVLRRPTAHPRGGLHTHYAVTIPADEYADWKDRLGRDFDLWEYQFGSITSLYFYDLDRNCVELAQGDADGPGIDGVFEIVLEVTNLGQAVGFYQDLGFVPVDEEADRVRLRGPMDLELWEPRVGLADARGGVHVDIGFGTDDPTNVIDSVADRIHEREEVSEGIRVKDPDGHVLTFVSTP